MPFPIELQAKINAASGMLSKAVVLHRGLTVLLGPNGSGKTHLLRGLRGAIKAQVGSRKVRFISAGRMGLQEQFRSDFDGQRNGNPNYEESHFGRKGEATKRHSNETISGDMQTVAARPDIQIKIQERLRKLLKREMYIEWDAGSLKISFARLQADSKPYSSGREASGLLHLVAILASIYDDDIGALLIDEPEVSLHPQLQAFLLKEMVAAAGDPADGKKLIVVATHSTEMLPLQRPEDLPAIIFCYDLNEDLVQIDPAVGELKNAKLRSLIARLGQEHKLALFSRRPLLVEGPSDVIVASALAQKTDTHLEAAGCQILPVLGKGQMATVAKLMTLLGKRPALLVDSDAIVDDMDLLSQFLANNPEANSSAEKLGASSALCFAQNIMSDFLQLVDSRWQEVASLSSSHPWWNVSPALAEQTARRRSAFSAIITATKQQLVDAGPDAAWTGIAARLDALISLLQGIGVFVLRRGLIEAYFANQDKSVLGKPAAAVEEADSIAAMPADEAKRRYPELWACLQYASASEAICEGDAIREILLAAASPIMARIHSAGADFDPTVVARSILGERATLFEYKLVDGNLVVSLPTKILSVTGFPLTIRPNQDVMKTVFEGIGNAP